MKKKLKRAIITKHISDFRINRRIKKSHQPTAGDVAVFQVVELGKHKAIQSIRGTNRYIFPGDQIMCAFGNRYASEQFEGYVPDGYCTIYHILGQGGVVGQVKSMHEKFDKIGATTLKLVGYAVDQTGAVINTRYLNGEEMTFNTFKMRDYRIFLSVGSSMDSGKTTSAAFLCRGLKKLKQNVAYIKLTGTVFAKDRTIVRDCGADISLDFSHFGFPSTYMCSMGEILNLFEGLLAEAETINPDTVVVEIADGLLQRETFQLLHCKRLMNMVDGVMLSCGDSLSVLTGTELLKTIGHPPFIVSGLITTSPLMTREVRTHCEAPVFHLEDFLTPEKLQKALALRISKRVA